MAVILSPVSPQCVSTGAPSRPGLRRFLLAALLVLAATLALMLAGTAAGHATTFDPVAPADPAAPTQPGDPEETGGFSVDINGVDGTPSTAVVTLIGITLLSVAPALLLMMTSFTKIFVVLAMTRNALSLPSIPPNQVLAGLALFLSLFIMAPVLTEINNLAVQPYLEGEFTFTEALNTGAGPLQQFMLAHTREEDIALMTRAAGQPNPESPETVPLLTLIPAFMISELRAAFIIGFVIFIPFLVIDLVVSAALMSMGMMMLPPVMISLPFKILLFVLVDGWGLIITSLVNSYQGGG
ncbi:flagellar type III secretion system pore protein FliP [Arthrobacter koreensis]|uniref:flagellar type III secretion system pore protein FliP n=1 Tax=Arthrobacter koreensis TaxID=199136 RepID=UPI002DBB1531|nr:flagellar type III secretion system pore protein FliP [Arthrobacter koreensis]MEB7447826.1 flagellar type III secretion system pore protein FliP [Arthrobacter koreensis]